MKHQAEYRDATAVAALAAAIRAETRGTWTIMEVCGGQTHGIVRFGIDRLLPPGISLLHGPGCPVCVTPTGVLDEAIALARKPGITLCSFGDMLRVPGSTEDLRAARSSGADVRVVWSPLDSLEIARKNADREVVFLAVGFETTAPAVALAVRQAAREGLANWSALVSHVRVPPALEAIACDPENRVQGFLAAGHVCTVMGEAEYRPLAARLGVPIVITGFEPVDLLAGILCCVRQLEAGRAEVENAYARLARPEGNRAAQAVIEEVFEVVPQTWRGLGELPASGLALRAAFAAQDARRRHPLDLAPAREDPDCQAGLVLQGRIRPGACPSFGTRCTPERPLGAPMVSAEGACAAWYRYRPSP